MLYELIKFEIKLLFFTADSAQSKKLAELDYQTQYEYISKKYDELLKKQKDNFELKKVKFMLMIFKIKQSNLVGLN